MSDAMEPGVMGVAHLLSQSSGIGLLPLVLLVLMSVGSCYYLLLKSWTGWRERRLQARPKGNTCRRSRIVPNLRRHAAASPVLDARGF